MTKLPNPVLVGFSTGGPPLSSQRIVKAVRRPLPGSKPHVTSTHPLPLESAPYFAALVASSDIPELLAWCDRILVLSRGRVVAVRAASDWTEDEILAAATSTSIAGEAA